MIWGSDALEIVPYRTKKRIETKIKEQVFMYKDYNFFIQQQYSDSITNKFIKLNVNSYWIIPT